MLLTRLFAYLEAKYAVGLMSVSEFIEAKLKQFTKRFRPEDYEIAVLGDGTTKIIELDKFIEEEMVERPAREQDLMQKYVESGIEIGNLDQQIREKQDELMDLRDAQEISQRDNPAPGPIRRELQSTFLWFLFFFIAEAVTLTLFFKDIFPESPIMLIILATGTCAGTFLLGLMILRSVEKRNIFSAILWSVILIAWGVGLGHFRALAVTAGQINYGLFILFAFLTIALPLAQANYADKCLKARSRLNETLEQQRRLGPLAAKTEAELKRLERLKKDALRRREGLGRQVANEEKQRDNGNRSEYIFLKNVEAKLTVYRAAYLFWATKKAVSLPPIAPMEVNREWQKPRFLSYN